MDGIAEWPGSYFRWGFVRKFSQEGNTAPEKHQGQIMPSLNFRVKTIHRKLFRIFLACENTVQPLFSNIVSTESKESSNRIKV